MRSATAFPPSTPRAPPSLEVGCTCTTMRALLVLVSSRVPSPRRIQHPPPRISHSPAATTELLLLGRAPRFQHRLIQAAPARPGFLRDLGHGLLHPLPRRDSCLHVRTELLARGCHGRFYRHDDGGLTFDSRLRPGEQVS